VAATTACFQLVAYKGTGYGVTNVVCGVPGVATGSRSLAEARLQSVGEQVQTLVATVGAEVGR